MREAISVAMIGFGEAGRAFAVNATVRAFDLKTQRDDTRAAMLAAYAATGVAVSEDVATAVSKADAVFSLVTADQAIAAAKAVAAHIRSGTFYFDGNSVAPATKIAAAQSIEAAGGHCIDMAIMAPVNPARLGVPLLLSGARAEEARGVLEAIGFTSVGVAGHTVGRASSIKMIRSVMVKGMEALIAEMALGARAAGVMDEVLASLDASERGWPWAKRVDYSLERMTTHGLRRAAEMEEVCKFLDTLGTGSTMTRGTVVRQREMVKP